MLDDFLKLIASLFVRIFFEIIGFYTGEVVLFFISFGRKKIRWDHYAEEKPAKFTYLTEFSVWIGVLFWICIAFGVNSFF